MEQLIDILPIDSYTVTGHYYPLIVIEEAVAEFTERVKERNGTLGECTVPELADWSGPPESRYMQVDMSKVSHIVRHVWIDNSVLRCKVHLLGKYAEIAKEMNLDFLGVPRATGVTDEQGICTKYTLITVDLALPEIG